MDALLALGLPLAAEESTAEEGLHIIIGMLVVGLIFLSVIAIGEVTHHLRSRRRSARR